MVGWVFMLGESVLSRCALQSPQPLKKCLLFFTSHNRQGLAAQLWVVRRATWKLLNFLTSLLILGLIVDRSNYHSRQLKKYDHFARRTTIILKMILSPFVYAYKFHHFMLVPDSHITHLKQKPDHILYAKCICAVLVIMSYSSDICTAIVANPYFRPSTLL